MQLTYDEIIDILDKKDIPTRRMGYTLPPGKYENNDFNLMSKLLLPNGVKLGATFDDIRLRSNLKNSQILNITEKVFFLLHNIKFYEMEFISFRRP